MSEMETKLFQLIVEGTPDAVIASSPEGVVAYWSPGAEATFGYTAEEAVGQNLGDLIAFGDSVATGADETGTLEALRRRKDGSLVYVSISHRRVTRSRDEDWVVRNETDITHIKVARDASILEARYRDLLESTPDAIVIANSLGRIVFVNAQAEQVFGYQRPAVIGQVVEALLPERYRAAHIAHRSVFLAQPRTRSMGAGLQLFGLRNGGEEFPVEISLSPLTADGEVFVMSAIRDVSGRVKADQKFRDLLEAAPDAMVIVDSEGRIVLINSQAERLFGYTREELLGQEIELLVPQRFRGRHPAHRSGYFAQPNLRPMGAGLQLFGQRRDGSEFPVEISLSPLQTEDGILVSSSIRDVTERKLVEARLQETNEKLEAASRAKDRFLASMSHELRTPLNAIIGFTGTLLMRLPGPLTTDQESQLRTVQSSGRHLLSLINDLLDLAKIGSGTVELKLEKLDCWEVLREVCAQLRPAAQAKGLEVELSAPHETLTLETDRRALVQILINLVNNAIKFTDVGVIRVIAERPEAPPGRTEIRVIDSGIGISPEDQQRLFQAFERAGSPDVRKAEGTGLGLHVSQKLAELLGGRIQLESAAGAGSVFTLVVPDRNPLQVG